MSVPPILKTVYREHIERYGEPSNSIVFDGGTPREGFPDRMDIFIWDADEACDITTFSTIGLAAAPMPKSGQRAELHFAVRRQLTDEQKHETARFLANLAVHPFYTGEPLDWWHTLSAPGKIPLFDKAECLLLHPKFIEDGWDTISTEEGTVRILNVVPVTREEKDLRKIDAILNRLEGVDIFAPR